MAIGAVLLNRLRDRRFLPTPQGGSHHEPGALSALFRDGEINLTPNAKAVRPARLAAAEAGTQPVEPCTSTILPGAPRLGFLPVPFSNPYRFPLSLPVDENGVS